MAHDLGEVDEVGDAPGFLELHVGAVGAAGDPDILPEILADLRDLREGLLESGLAAGHAAFVPDEHAEFPMETVDGFRPLHVHELVDPLLHLRFDLLEFGGAGRHGAGFLGREVIGKGRGDDKITIGESLHERARAETVRAVVGEIRFAEDVESGNVGHEIVIDPEAAHGVVDGGIDLHRRLVGVLAGDLFIHLEKVAVAGLDRLFAEPVDRVAEVEEHPESRLGHPPAFVADLLRGSRGDVARREVSERGILALEKEIASVLGNVFRHHGAAADLRGIFLRLGNPDTTIVPERLGHEGELALIVTAHRNAGGVDLGEAGIGHVGTALVGTQGGRDVAAHRVGRKEENVAVAARGKNDGIGSVARDLAGGEIAHDNPLGMPVDNDEVEHLGAGVHFHATFGDFFLKRLITTDEELLTGLTTGVEGAADLGSPKGAVREGPAVFTGEGHSLGNALVDDLQGDLGEAMDVGLAGAEVTALDRVVEETPDGVSVILVVLCAIDPALGGDGVGAARAVLIAEALHLVAEFGERRGGGTSGKTRADDDDGVFAFVRRVDEFRLGLVLGPLSGKRSLGDGGVQGAVRRGSAGGVAGHGRSGGEKFRGPDFSFQPVRWARDVRKNGSQNRFCPSTRR